MPRQSNNPAAVCNLPDHDTMVANILAEYRRATPEHVGLGWAWYHEAQEFARTLAAGTDYPVRTVAGVIAALSPQCAWQKNKADAIAAIDVHSIIGQVTISLHTKRQMAKVARILDGETPETVLRGPKERAFCANILGNYALVTVDRHAAATAIGRSLPHDKGGIGRGAYKRIAAAYDDAATILSVPVAIVQAVCWVARRRTHI